MFNKFIGLLLFLSCQIVLASTLQFLTVSDPHINLKLNHHMVIDPRGIDPKNDLDQETLLKLTKTINLGVMQEILPKNPDFILCLGDYVGHKNFLVGQRLIAVKNNQAAFYHMMRKLFPNAPIIVVFGNNDSGQKNYGKYFFHQSSPFIIAKDAGFKNGFISTGVVCNHQNNKVFPCLQSGNDKLGFFSILIKPKLVLLGLNSVMFSTHQAIDKTAIDQQMIFLNDSLKDAKQHHQSVLIAMHIPVGVNINNGRNFWRLDVEKNFLDLISQYKNYVRGILVSHTHMDELKVLNFRGKLIGEYYTPSLSTSHGNSPGLRLYTMGKINDDWYIQNYETFQIHDNSKPVLTPYYNFAQNYCRKKAVSDINDCLINVPVKVMWSHYVVGNPNHPLMIIHNIKDYIFNTVISSEQS